MPAVCGSLIYGLTTTAGELVNQCNWFWSDHKINYRCAVDLSGLGLSFGIMAASSVVWTQTGIKSDNNANCESFLISIKEMWANLLKLVYNSITILRDEKLHI